MWASLSRAAWSPAFLGPWAQGESSTPPCFSFHFQLFCFPKSSCTAFPPPTWCKALCLQQLASGYPYGGCIPPRPGGGCNRLQTPPSKMNSARILRFELLFLFCLKKKLSSMPHLHIGPSSVPTQASGSWRRGLSQLSNQKLPLPLITDTKRGEIAASCIRVGSRLFPALQMLPQPMLIAPHCLAAEAAAEGIEEAGVTVYNEVAAAGKSRTGRPADAMLLHCPWCLHSPCCRPCCATGALMLACSLPSMLGRPRCSLLLSPTIHRSGCSCSACSAQPTA